MSTVFDLEDNPAAGVIGLSRSAAKQIDVVAWNHTHLMKTSPKTRER